jgi:6-phosphogluconolactonase (cycloisomerase 2 family)
MKGKMTKTMTLSAAAAFVAAVVMTLAGPAMAQSGNTCVYANDDVFWMGNGPNTVDGYLVTTTSQTYLSPMETGGYGGGGSGSRNIVINHETNILYAADTHSGDVAAMTINPANCQLTLLGNFPVSLPNKFGLGLAISPDGKWLYADAVYTQKLISLGINKDGSLTPAIQKITLPSRPSSMAVSPDSATLIVGLTGFRGGKIGAYSYSINPANGKLTQVSTAVTKGPPGGFSIDSQGKFVYVAESSGSVLRAVVLEIGAGSTLTFVRAYNFKEVPDYQSAADALLSTDGKYLYMTNLYGGTVTTLMVDSITGSLKYISTANDEGDSFPLGLATSSDGAFVFSGNVESSIGILAAATDGSLTSLGMFPLVINSYPYWLAAITF